MHPTGMNSCFLIPYICSFLLILHHIVLVSAKLDSGGYDYISGLQTSVVQLISNDASKTKLAILAFLYCGEFVQKSDCFVSYALGMLKLLQEQELNGEFLAWLSQNWREVTMKTEITRDRLKI